MKALGPRERAGDYLAELQARFGDRPQLIELQRGWRLNPAAAMGGFSDEQRKPYKIHEGIAYIDVTGVLSNDPWWFDETGYADIQNDAALAADDAEVDGILLRLNSPGGSTENAFETAALLAEVGKQKPMWCAVDTIAYSAGYLLASQASRIYVPKISGGVGSIGVYMMHVDYSSMLSKAGLKVTFISAGEGKTDGNPYEPLSKVAQQQYQDEVDRLYGEFVAAVSHGRGLTEDAVRSLGAWTYPGVSRSMAAGLADAEGSLAETHAAFRTYLDKKSARTFSMAASAGMNSTQKESTMDEQITTQADAAATATEPVAAEPPAATVTETVETVTRTDADRLIAEARGAGQLELEANLTEIKQLCDIARKPEMFGKFFSEKMTVAQVREALVDMAATEDEAVQTDSHVGATGAGAMSAIDSQAAEIAKREGISKEQAFANLLNENPQVYEQYLQEQALLIKAARA